MCDIPNGLLPYIAIHKLLSFVLTKNDAGSLTNLVAQTVFVEQIAEQIFWFCWTNSFANISLFSLSAGW